MGVDGTFYKILLFLHVLCVIAGFGSVGWNAVHVAWARRGAGAGGADPVDFNPGISRVAEFVIYAVFILGLLVVATSRRAWKFDQSWLSASMALYIVDLGVLHGLIRPNQKQYRQVEARMVGAAPAGGGPPAEVAVLERLQQRIAVGWAIFDVIVFVVLWLMLFRPGH
ncbi:MAG TPA: hypothetical protein VGH66_03010 [Acidimicrobiales bacterium]|jgi:hypothetical protein